MSWADGRQPRELCAECCCLGYQAGETRRAWCAGYRGQRESPCGCVQSSNHPVPWLCRNASHVTSAILRWYHCRSCSRLTLSAARISWIASTWHRLLAWRVRSCTLHGRIKFKIPPVFRHGPGVPMGSDNNDTEA